MKVSIITTVYKAEKDLPRLLDSMMAQKSPELEFFLIDNGSPDKCGEICREYMKKDSRFVLYELKDNIGYIRARNLGIQECTGEYIGFCDSDDYLEPSGYDNAVIKIKESECDLYLTAYRTVYKNRTSIVCMPFEIGVYKNKDIDLKIVPQAFGRLPGRDMLHGFAWKQIVKKSIVYKNDISFDEKLKPYEDQVFNIDVLRNCESVVVDNNIIYNYVINENSITSQLYSKLNLEAELDRIFALNREKEKRVINKIEASATSNESLEMLYECILSISKQKIGVNYICKDLKKIYENDSGGRILENSSKEVSLCCRILRICIKRKWLGLFILLLRFALILKRRK